MRPAESFVSQPVRSLQTMLRVLAEDDPRLPTVVPDGIYGPSTMQAVSAFQRQYGLPVNGIVDEDVWDAIVAAYEPALIRVDKAEPIEIIMDANKVYVLGDTGPYIYLLQSMLTQLSKDHTIIIAPNHNGVLDDSTAEALVAFQKLAGLPENGQLDKITWKHLVYQFSLNAHHNTAPHGLDATQSPPPLYTYPYRKQ